MRMMTPGAQESQIQGMHIQIERDQTLAMLVNAIDSSAGLLESGLSGTYSKGSQKTQTSCDKTLGATVSGCQDLCTLW